MKSKQEAFIGCERHKPPSGWNYYCHDCLVKTLGILADQIEALTARMEEWDAQKRAKD